MIAPSTHLVIPPLVGLALFACDAQISSTCGDGIADVEEACLVARDASTEALLAVGDVDGDGRIDAVVIVDRENARIAVQRGLADGSFGPPGAALQGVGLPVAAVVGDADGDAAPDLLLWWPGISGGRICGHEVDGSGALVERWCHDGNHQSSWFSSHLHVGALGPAGERGFVAWARGEALLVIDPANVASKSGRALPITANGTVPLVVADLDHDRVDELLWVEGRELRVYPYEGEPIRSEVPGNFGRPIVADFDGDGIDDLALYFGPTCEHDLEVWIELSSGLHVTSTFDIEVGCGQVSAADLDGDGAAELLVLSDVGLEGLWGRSMRDGGELSPRLLDAGPNTEGGPRHYEVAKKNNGLDQLFEVVAITDVTWESGYLPQKIVATWTSEH